jgi:hypothetical protein
LHPSGRFRSFKKFSETAKDIGARICGIIEL